MGSRADLPVVVGGANGSGGMIATGGAGGAGGRIDAGGFGGVATTGGASGFGGVATAGGASGFGGVIGSGGVSGTGGLVGSGGVSASGGVSSTGGIVGTGGVLGTGGVTGPDSSIDAGDVFDVNATGGSGGDVEGDGSGGTGGTDAADGGGAPGVALIKLTGTTFGSGPAFSTNPTATYDKAFDGDITTFVDDAAANDGYTGIDLGDGQAASVLAIRFYPRLNWNDRVVGGKFQCSNTSSVDGYVDLFTITATPPLAWTEVSIANAPACRFLRYVSPAGGFDNVAEVEFWGMGPVDAGPGTADAGPPLVNLSNNKPVLASSQQTQGGKGAVMGNDGDLTTMFCPANGAFSVWYMVDLGAVYPLAQTDISVEMSAATYQYQIEVSVDRVNWTTAVVASGSTPYGRGTLANAIDVRARFVRLTITSVSDGYWGCFREFIVWGHDAPTTDAGTGFTNLSIHKPVAASSQDARRGAAHGNDGILATSFCPSSGIFSDWWRVDLGAVHDVAQTDIVFEEQNSPYKYSVEVSLDDVNWTTVVDQSNNTNRAGAILSDVFSAQARYVRMTIYAAPSNSWGCFWEFTVWGN